MVIKCNTGYLDDFVGGHEWEAMVPQVKAAHELLHNKSGLGKDFLRSEERRVGKECRL